MILYVRMATYVNYHMSVTCLGHDPVCEGGHICQLSHMYVTCLGHDPVCEGGHAANVLVVHHLQQATLPPAEYIKAQLRH